MLVTSRNILLSSITLLLTVSLGACGKNKAVDDVNQENDQNRGYFLATKSVVASNSCNGQNASNGYPYCTNGSNTGFGWGWDTSIFDPRGSHSCVVPSSNRCGSGDDGSLPPLSFYAPGNLNFGIYNYGSELANNKAILIEALRANSATVEEQAIVLAIAMQETTLMREDQRDASKDWTPSANISFLNVNYDMITKVGYEYKDYGASLNTLNKLPQVVGYLLKAFHQWGIERTLNFHRGGWTAFQDGYSYGAATYRNAIATMYRQIANDIKLETDGRRLEINVPGV